MDRITFFTKSDCPLCRSAWYVLQRVRSQVPFELESIDICAPGQEPWFEAYRDDIPVVHLNGREIFRHRINERQLRLQLEGAT